MAALSPIMLARFWGRVRVASKFRCWDWTGATSNGYGRFIRKRSHRIAYELVNGPIPKGFVVRHRCDNRLCCNPHHLIAGTQAENARDAMERKRLPVGSLHSRTKLNGSMTPIVALNNSAPTTNTSGR
jgi:hypothetical protein